MQGNIVKTSQVLLSRPTDELVTCGSCPCNWQGCSCMLFWGAGMPVLRVMLPVQLANGEGN